MTKERYNELLRDMFLIGCYCGITKPHELICNYENYIIFAPDEKEFEEFLNKAIVDIYSAIAGKLLSFEEANSMYDLALNGEKK